MPRPGGLRLVMVGAAIVAAIGASASARATGRTPVAREGTGFVLVELTPHADAQAAIALLDSGATVISSELRLYRLRATRSQSVLSDLRARGALRLTTVDRPIGSLAVADFSDPLVAQEWWRSALGLTTLVPPGPGKPVTIIDSGANFGHPEFTGRANFLALDPQEPAPIGGIHGTAVASLIGAPANGVGMVGIYPDADLASWDAARGNGTQLETSQIAAGILAAAERGPGVINLSLGSNQSATVIQQAIAKAIRKGLLIVAASGNDGETGSPLTYPASLPHILTVGATGRDNQPASFSSRSRYVDLAAPGVDMTIADGGTGGWTVGDGTSFAAPIVTGAAAWVWTARPALDASQLFEVMRRSAIDTDTTGRDTATGFGLLNVASALTYAPVPVTDPLEPNDNISYVKPGALYDTGVPPVTTRSKRRNTVTARLDSLEDPQDVYRVWLPAGRTTTVLVTSDQGVDVRLLDVSVASVTKASGAKVLATAVRVGSTRRLSYANRGPGTFAYLTAAPAVNTADATYMLQISS